MIKQLIMEEATYNKGEWHQVQKTSQKSSEGKKRRRVATNGKEAGVEKSLTLWISSVARTAQRMVWIRELKWDPHRNDSGNASNA